jgi:hypothetical protein
MTEAAKTKRTREPIQPTKFSAPLALPPSKSAVETAQASARGAPTKTAKVLELLRRSTGASLDELVAATGWLPHTTRAALTGLRKKGHSIAKEKVDGLTRYSIAQSVQP